MWYDSAAFGLGIRDVIGAWLVCLAVAAVCFGCIATAGPRRHGVPLIQRAGNFSIASAGAAPLIASSISSIVRPRVSTP
jgi:hypothetical protein